MERTVELTREMVVSRSPATAEPLARITGIEAKHRNSSAERWTSKQLAFANVTAALSCRGLDGRSRIPQLPEVLQVLETRQAEAQPEPAPSA